MSNPDNIAALIVAGNEKADSQATIEQNTVDTAAKTAEIDKVSAVDQPEVASEDAGLAGAARSTAPVTENGTQEASKFGPTVTGAIAAVNAYEGAMGRTRAVTSAGIDSMQAKLYLAISAIVKAEDNSDFMGGMEFLFRKFRENKTGAFGGDMVRRRVSYMKQPSGDKAMSAYMGFIDLLQVFADPKGRKAQWSRFNKQLALEFAPAGEKRQRLETYMSRICA